MLHWPRIYVRQYEKDPFWISIDLTKRPFLHTKTNLKSLMIVSCYFSHAKIFVPIFFALLEDDQTPEGLSKALLKFRSEVLDTYPMVPT